MTQESIIVKEYYKNPVNNHIMKDFSAKAHQWNSICWDTVDVFLKITNWKIDDYSFAWDPSMITSAAASLLSDLIIWESMYDVLNWTKEVFDKEGFEVSYRRRRAVVSALLAARNAIHLYKKDWVVDEYDDLLD